MPRRCAKAASQHLKGHKDRQSVPSNKAARARGKYARQAPTHPLIKLDTSSQGCRAMAAAASLQVARSGSTATVLSMGSSVLEQQLRMVVGRSPPAKAQMGCVLYEAEMRANIAAFGVVLAVCTHATRR